MEGFLSVGKTWTTYKVAQLTWLLLKRVIQHRGILEGSSRKLPIDNESRICMFWNLIYLWEKNCYKSPLSVSCCTNSERQRLMTEKKHKGKTELHSAKECAHMCFAMWPKTFSFLTNSNCFLCLQKYSLPVSVVMQIWPRLFKGWIMLSTTDQINHYPVDNC